MQKLKIQPKDTWEHICMPMNIAAGKGDLNMLIHFFSLGFFICDGVMHTAVHKKKLDIVKYLVENGADVNQGT